MTKLIHILWVLGLISALIACPAPKSNSAAGGNENTGDVNGGESEDTFKVSPEILDKTAWKMVGTNCSNGSTNGEMLRIFYKEDDEFKVFEYASCFTIQNAMTRILLYWNVSDSLRKFAKCVGNEVQVNAGVHTTTYFFEENLQSGKMMSWYNPNRPPNPPDKTWDMERIPYPDLSLKGPNWTIDNLDGQKWIFIDHENYPRNPYQYPIFFKKENGQQLNLYTIGTNKRYSSSEEAFAVFDLPDHITKQRLIVKEINNTEHFITVELGNRYKWKLYFPNSNEMGVFYLGKAYNNDGLTTGMPGLVSSTNTFWILERVTK